MTTSEEAVNRPMDIVTQLRNIADGSDHDEECMAYGDPMSLTVQDESKCDCSIKTLREAADEIERLRAVAWTGVLIAARAGSSEASDTREETK